MFRVVYNRFPGEVVQMQERQNKSVDTNALDGPAYSNYDPPDTVHLSATNTPTSPSYKTTEVT